MKVVDANVLIYAVNKDAPHHSSAKAWLDSALNGSEAIGFAWVGLLAFLRLATRRELFPQPLDADRAADIIEAWLDQPSSVILHPTPRHLGVLRGLLSPLGTGANLVGDAHLAALAVEHGAEVVSFDTDFSRFSGLRVAAPDEP